jgi:hypothetical protein
MAGSTLGGHSRPISSCTAPGDRPRAAVLGLAADDEIVVEDVDAQ